MKFHEVKRKAEGEKLIWGMRSDVNTLPASVLHGLQLPGLSYPQKYAW